MICGLCGVGPGHFPTVQEGLAPLDHLRKKDDSDPAFC
ncbi:hypothetical protein RGAI101_523 [Roseobacter sp. GAI101]|nr:hypothetical protein RGAI101_523 [Roseobacter sp. GAI101]